MKHADHTHNHPHPSNIIAVSVSGAAKKMQAGERAGSSGIPEHLMLNAHMSSAGSKIVMVSRCNLVSCSLGWHKHDEVRNAEESYRDFECELDRPPSGHGPG